MKNVVLTIDAPLADLPAYEFASDPGELDALLRTYGRVAGHMVRAVDGYTVNARSLAGTLLGWQAYDWHPLTRTYVPAHAPHVQYEAVPIGVMFAVPNADAVRAAA